jgi:CheY-like chemotaxis protein
VERNIHGTGLGLAICRKYAQAMGGEVGAVSANGETTFYLNVPFHRAGEAAPATVLARPAHALPAKALAIEDEDYNRIVLGNILQKMNYSVDWATTGAEALKLAQENGYDIILTDYRLPDTNGVELTKKILALCPDPKPAVFAVTAYSTKERRDECLGAGMAGFISKPITLEKLRTTLAGWGENNLATISLETSRLPPPVFNTEPPAAITSTWTELVNTIPADAKRAADVAHRLNNLCRAHGLIDAAEQFELLEGALERGEPAEPFLRASEALLRC